MSGTLSRPEAFDSFGGWGGELLQARDGRFVLIDWPGLGAAPRGSLPALALGIPASVWGLGPGALGRAVVAGLVPAALDVGRFDDLRLWGGRTASCGGPA